MTINEFISSHINDDVRTLALQRNRYPDIDLNYAVAQIAGRQRIREKLPEIYANPEWELPVTLSLEQCSSQTAACYKADLLTKLLSETTPEAQHRTLVDLTGGFGIDFYYCSQRFDEAHYVEQNAELCRIAEHNFCSRNASAPDRIVHNCDSVVFLREMEHVTAIVIDPARRDQGGRKVAALSDCTPDLTQIHPLLTEKADIVLVKLSPMLDMHQALRQLPETTEVHILSLMNECKEMLFVLRREPATEITIHCVNLPHDPEFIYTI